MKTNAVNHHLIWSHEYKSIYWIYISCRFRAYEFNIFFFTKEATYTLNKQWVFVKNNWNLSDTVRKALIKDIFNINEKL